MDDVAVVHVAEQRRRRLRQVLRQIAQRRELALGLRPIDAIEMRRPQKPADRRAQRLDLRRRHDAIGDAEQHDRDAVVVRPRTTVSAASGDSRISRRGAGSVPVHR